jgi:glycosyltransferase-like protein
VRRALRIAMLTHSTNPRGGVVHALQLSEALTALGHDVVLHAPDSKGAGFFRPTRCKTRPFPVAPAARDTHAMIEQRIAEYVEHLADARDFDLYHAHDGISGNALATLKSRGRITKFVRTVHHIDDFVDTRIACLQSRSIQAADAWMTVSNLWRNRLHQDFEIKASVCGNGVDCDRFRPEPDGNEPDLRRRLGLGAGPVFLAVGGIEERKNTIRVLDAFAQIVAIRPDAELVIAGGATLLNHVTYHLAFSRRLAEGGAALAGSVRLPGVIADADMPGLYRLATALVFPSVKEGFGLCVLEALASGVPVIASRTEPFVSYLMADDAIWCDPLNVTTIADAMALALRPEFAKRLRCNGPHVAGRFGWRAVAEAHEPQYQQLLEVADA